MYIPFHLDISYRVLQMVHLIKNLIENMDETDFVVNMDNRRTLWYKGHNAVSYVEVESREYSMTMVIRIYEGW